jgi:hypothetical protein
VGAGPGSYGAAYTFHASSEGSWRTASSPRATLKGGGDAVATSGDGTLGAVTGGKAAYVFHVPS